MVELTGGRRPAEAAAAVAQLPFRVYDCQRGVGGAVAVRRAQRHRRDVTVRAQRARRSDRRTGDGASREEGGEKKVGNCQKQKLLGRNFVCSLLLVIDV